MLNKRQFEQLVRCRSLYSDFHQRYNNTPRPAGICPPNFDKDMCWDSAEVNTTSSVLCPFSEFCDECTLPRSETLVYKECFPNGTWSETDYTKCVYIFRHATQVKCAAVNCYLCRDIKQTVADISVYLASASLVLLVFCLIVFNAYRRLQSMRVTIRKHLCTAFALRFVAVIIFTSIAGSSHFFSKHSHCDSTDVTVREVLCKLVLFVQLYGLNASIWWMFVEGIYLSSRLSTFGMHSEGSIVLYCFIGWGTPFIWSFVWALLMEFDGNKNFCWMPYTLSSYKWIIAVPMLTALVANFVILLIVVGILVQKLWAENSNEDRKLRKTIKATLILVPVLGVPNLLVFYQPHQRSVLPYYMISCALLQNSQGIFIGLAYCVFNKEVRACIKRTYYSVCTGCVRDPLGQTGTSNKHFWSMPKSWHSQDSDHHLKQSPLIARPPPEAAANGALDNTEDHELTKLNQDNSNFNDR